MKFPQSSPVVKISILGSGSGSNMLALADAISQKKLAAEIVLVLSDQPESGILKRAQQGDLPSGIIDCAHPNRFSDQEQATTAQRLLDAGTNLVCLAGFMRLVKQPLLDAFPNRILNIHPSLLPHYPGLRAWEQALTNGATETGCTVHYVDAGMDTGPIILQARVPVLPQDTADTLHARIQKEEHSLYPEAVKIAAENINSTS